jgi:hypothetical protein
MEGAAGVLVRICLLLRKGQLVVRNSASAGLKDELEMTAR